MKRWYANLACILCLAALLSSSATASAEEQATVLVYHRFDPALNGPTTISIPEFESQLAWLFAHGYRMVPLHAIVAGLRGDAAPVESPAAAITVDDGHESVYTELYPLVLRRRLPVTLFVIPALISRSADNLTWRQLDEMAASGLVEVQSHTLDHPEFRKERSQRGLADYGEFVERQLFQSKVLLEQHLHRTVDLLAWPYGTCDAELELAAARAGYLAAFALGDRPAVPGVNTYAVPRYMVTDRDRGPGFERLLERRHPPEICEP